MSHNFDVVKNAYTGAKYDLLSIMHYDRFAFSVDPSKPSMDYVGKGVYDELGQRIGLSSYDVVLGLGVGVCVPEYGCEARGRKEARFALCRGIQNGLTASPCTMNS
jgi:hypothetical protein